MYSNNGSGVRFVFVYILEAHAVDEWPVSATNTIISQHKNMQERVDAANFFLDQYPLHAQIEFYLDNEDNDFNTVYASWPFRYWIINDGKIALKAMPDGDMMSLKDLTSWLMQYVNATN